MKNPTSVLDKFALLFGLMLLPMLVFAQPANDDCGGAIALTVNTDLACGAVTSGTTVASTASPEADDVSGTPDNDVWFTFTATATSHEVSLINIVAVVGTSTDMGMGLYSGTCGAYTFEATSDPEVATFSGLTIGTTYTLRIYGWYAVGNGSYSECTFDVCVGTEPTPGCTTNEAGTPDATCGNDDVPITWDAESNASGYSITVGTTTGGTDIENDTDNGGGTSYTLTGASPATTYYFTVTPYSGGGSASGCTEYSFTTAATGCTCTSNPSSNDATGLGDIVIGGTTYPSSGDVTYEDYTGGAVEMLSAGLSANMMITFETGYTYDANVWIDLNDDFTFDASELVYSGESTSSNPTTLDASFLMPASAPIGVHVMRLGTADSGQSTPNACYNGSFGVTADFNVEIIAASCAPPVSASETVIDDCVNGQFSIEVDITDLGNDTPSINDGTNSFPVAATGIITVGPYASGSSLTLTLEHGSDVTCDAPLGTFTFTCPPANNLCADAIALTVNADLNCGSFESVNLVAATASGEAEACSGTFDDDVWFSFTATATEHEIQATNFTGTSSDLVFQLSEGDCGALTELVCHDTPNEGFLATSLTIGNDYFIRVATWSSTAGQNSVFDICVGTVVPPACAVNQMAAADPACGNYDVPLTWDASIGADGYSISIGSTAGGTDIENNTDIFGATSFTLTGVTTATTYYWTVYPYNAAGAATGCTEFSFTTVAPGCTCTSMPTSNDGTGLGDVVVGATTYPSSGDVVYEDYTGGVVESLDQGLNANVMITYETGYTYGTNIWIDFNDDFVFDDATELVYSGESLGANPTTLDASFVMPATATVGTHQMRIGTADSGQSTPNSCYSGSFGVTLDFMVNITVPTCSPPVSASETIVPDCTNGQYSIEIDVTDLGNDTPSINDGTTSFPVAATGITTVGPYTSGTSATLTLEHGSDATCDVPLGSFTFTCPPANDDCVDAIVLTVNADLNCGSFENVNLVAATASADAEACSGSFDDDVWFSFVATETDHQITASNFTGTSSDLIFQLSEGACGTLTELVCHDTPNEGFLATGLTVGNSYFIRVATWSSTPGQNSVFDICVGTLIPPACTINETATPDPACGNFDVPFTWDAEPIATGYNISIGTTTGGTDIENNFDNGNSTSYNLSGATTGTTYFWTVYPYNSAGAATGCTEFSFTTAATGCFCSSMPTSNDGTGLGDIVIGLTTYTSNGDVNYEDYTGGVAEKLAQGVTANAMITFETGYTYDTHIWIDFNDDFTFDNATELVYSGESLSANPSTLDASFTMPAGAALGFHQMRIGTADSGQSTPNPCYSGSFGVTADLMVEIIEPECDPPAATAVAYCNPSEFYIDVTVSALGDGTPVLNDGTTTIPVTALATYTFGPYAFSTPTTIVLEHGADSSCDITVGTYDVVGGCPPSNDECSGATALTVGMTGTCPANVVNGDATYATENPEDLHTCDAFVNIGVWYTFVAPMNGEVIVNYTAGTATGSPGLVLFDGCGGMEISATCQNNPFGGFSNITGLTGGDTYYMSFWFDSGAGTFDLCLEEPNPCLVPTNYAFDDNSSTSVEVSWTAGSTETLWDIEVVLSGVTPTGTPTYNDITTNFFEITSLLPDTDYTVYLRADCGGDNTDASSWISVGTFTLCETVPIVCGTPFVQDYDGSSSLNCILLAGGPVTGPTGATVSGWILEGFANNGGTSQAARVNLWDTNTEDWLLSEEFDMSAGVAYSLDFDIALTTYNSTTGGNLGSDDEVQILITTDGTTWTSLMTWDANSTVSPTGESVSIDLTAYAGNSAVTIGYWATEGVVDDTEDMEFYFDNMTIDCTTCPDDFANGNNPNSQPSLTGLVDINADYETDGDLESNQEIGTTNPAISVDYDGKTGVLLTSGFSVEAGVTFDAFVNSGCDSGAGGNQIDGGGSTNNFMQQQTTEDNSVSLKKSAKWKQIETIKTESK